MAINYTSRINKAYKLVGQVIKINNTQWKVLTNSRSSIIAGKDSWIVTKEFEIYKCECPDYLGKIQQNELLIKTWNLKDIPYNNPCKHIIATLLKEGLNYLDIIIEENKLKVMKMSYTQITNTTETVLISFTGLTQVKVFSFKVGAETGNCDVTIRNGLGGNIIDKFSLIARGDEKGFITNHAEWIFNNDMTIELSANETVNVYYRALLL